MERKHEKHIQNPSEEEREKIWGRIERIRFGVLNTVEAGGEVTSRPLTNQEVVRDDVLTFFIAADSDLARIVARSPRVNITYTDSGDNFFAAIGGRARVSRDRAKVRELWNTMSQAWFPGGPDDPNLALLHIDVEQVEYWDSGSSRLVQFLTMAKSAVTHSPPSEIGEHGEYHV